ncbi:MAG: tetratricopeptide repeat protein [Bacteroidia bacterium]
MNKTTILLIILTLFSISGLAQNKTDSILKIWNDETVDDSIKMYSLHDLIHNDFLFRNIDSCLILADKLYDFAIKNNYQKEAALALNEKGNVYLHLQKPNKAHRLYRESYEIRSTINDRKGMAGSLINLGIIHSIVGKFKQSIYLLKEGVKICDEINEHQFKIEALLEISSLYAEQGDISKGATYAEKALQLSRKIKSNNQIANCLNRRGVFSFQLGDTSKSRTCFNEAIDIHKTETNQLYYVGALNNLAYFHLNNGSLNKAQTILYKALNKTNKLKNNSTTITIYNTIGELYLTQNLIDSAIYYCSKCLSLIHENPNIQQQKDIYNCLFTSYKKSLNNEKALEYLELVKVLDDSLNAQQLGKELERMEFEKQILRDSLAHIEQLRIKKLNEELAFAARKRKNIIQYSLVVIIVLLLATIIAIATKFKISPRLASGLIFIFFILTFEFLLVVLDPWVDSVSNGEVGWKIGINTAIALVLFGIHQVSEKKLKMVILKSDL